MTLNKLFKNTTYDDTLFSAEAKSAIESRSFMKTVRGAEVPYITCAIRNKDIKLTPEEAVRQLYIYKLMNDYGYMANRIQLETPIHFGREVKRADIAIMDKDRPMVPYIIVELKKPKLTDGKEQLKSYCNATGAPIGVWTNGEQISCYNRKDPNFFEEISDIPKATQKLSDIINEKFTYEDLKRKDKISTQKKSLRSLIKEMEDEVLASAGVDSFEEIFKLIFTKLYDELICANDPSKVLDKLKVQLEETMPEYKKIPVHKPYVLGWEEGDVYFFQIKEKIESYEKYLGWYALFYVSKIYLRDWNVNGVADEVADVYFFLTKDKPESINALRTSKRVCFHIGKTGNRYQMHIYESSRRNRPKDLTLLGKCDGIHYPLNNSSKGGHFCWSRVDIREILYGYENQLKLDNED